MKVIDIRLLRRNGLFTSLGTFTTTWQDNTVTEAYFDPNSRYLPLSYDSQNLSGEKLEQSISLESTPCYFGGSRHWFSCPLCHQRIASLYLVQKTFACRHCHNLTYASKNKKRNSPFYPYVRVLNLNEKIERFLPKVKTENYAGKPTKKQQKLAKLQRQLYEYSFLILEEKEV